MNDQRTARTGRFSFDLDTAEWQWDDHVYAIHGIDPGTVRPTTEMMLASKHPEDRERVRQLFSRVARTGESFSSSYRIVGADGAERRVVLVGESSLDDGGRPTRVEGYYLDLTDDFEAEAREESQAAVQAAAARRAEIEQTKGALMLAYGLRADAAFAMLRWWSSNSNVKVRDLAARFVDSLGERALAGADTRTALDRLLHELAAPGTGNGRGAADGAPKT